MFFFFALCVRKTFFLRSEYELSHDIAVFTSRFVPRLEKERATVAHGQNARRKFSQVT